MRMIDAVLFDLGDTLLHFETDQARRFLESATRPAYDRLVELGFRPPDYKVYFRAIKSRFLRVDLVANANQLGILVRHVELIARNETGAAVSNKADRAKAVPLRFKNPLRIRKWIVYQRGQHRMNHFGHAGFTRL